jgi:DNA-directed RNA polymerase specialized sigma24 family protein
MLDTGEYNIDQPYHQYGDGYDRLGGEWLAYYKVATKFVHKAQAQDRDDLLHTIMLNLAVAGRNNGHRPDNASWMYRIASFTLAQYWRDYYLRVNGIDCGHCSNQQRKRCKADGLYGSQCPRAIKVESLQKPIADGDGHLTELGELINDDKAIDLDTWLDSKTFLLSCPQRLQDIAQKKVDRIPLDDREKMYLQRVRQRERKRLF